MPRHNLRDLCTLCSGCWHASADDKALQEALHIKAQLSKLAPQICAMSKVIQYLTPHNEIKPLPAASLLNTSITSCLNLYKAERQPI